MKVRTEMDVLDVIRFYKGHSREFLFRGDFSASVSACNPSFPSAGGVMRE